MINRPNFMGLDGFAWWFGVVENRKDPLLLGRCQVRIHGWHTENLMQIPTQDLPWAHPIMPLSTNTSTVSSAKEGDMVFGFTDNHTTLAQRQRDEMRRPHMPKQCQSHSILD